MEVIADTAKSEETGKAIKPRVANGASLGSDYMVDIDRSSQKSSERKTQRRPYILCSFVFAALCVILLALVVVFVVLYEGARDNSKGRGGNTHCYSKECMNTATQMMSAMNTSEDPCLNFYQYACGNWIQQASIPDHNIQYGRLDDLAKQNKIIVKDILNELKKKQGDKKSDGSAINKAINYYQSCTVAQTKESIGEAIMQEVIKELGSSPITDANFNSSSWNALNVFVKLHKLGMSPLFSIDVLPDLRNSSNHIILLVQSGIGLKMHREAYLNNASAQTIATKEAYIQFSKKIWTKVGPGIGLRYLDGVVKFETHLAKLSRPLGEQRNFLKYYERMTIKDFVNRTNIPQEWLIGLLERTVLQKKRSLSLDEQIASLNIDFIQGAYSAFMNLTTEVQASYLVWQGIQYMIPVIIGPYEDVLLDYFEAVGGLKDKPPAWELCVDRTLRTFGFVLTRHYVERKYDAEAHTKSLQMINQIKRQFQANLQQINWLDEATKEYAIRKSIGMIENIGYPDKIFNLTYYDKEYRDLNIQQGQTIINILEVKRYGIAQKYFKYGKAVVRSDWEFHPLIVNAYYSPTENKITFPAAIFQWPFYDKHAPSAHAYASIGMVFGHEISHAFDNMGKNFDINGDFRMWWTQKSHKEFNERSQCFVDQYNSFKVLEGSKFEGKINGLLTLGENIADNGGLRQAWMAYQSWIKNNDKEQELPGLGLNSDQLFFLSFAQCWCTKYRAIALPMMLRAPHSLPEFRVTGVLQNMEEFSKAFRCKAGSRMNPKKKCLLW